MSESQKQAALSMRYCPTLHENVLVMSQSENGKPETKMCLSSHLCHADARILCQKRGVISSKEEEAPPYL